MEVLSALAIPAVVKAFELLNKKDFKSLFKIVLAVVVGTAAGFVGILPGVAVGAAAGLTASGIVTVAGYAGEKAKAK